MSKEVGAEGRFDIFLDSAIAYKIWNVSCAIIVVEEGIVLHYASVGLEQKLTVGYKWHCNDNLLIGIKLSLRTKSGQNYSTIVKYENVHLNHR